MASEVSAKVSPMFTKGEQKRCMRVVNVSTASVGLNGCGVKVATGLELFKKRMLVVDI